MIPNCCLDEKINNKLWVVFLSWDCEGCRTLRILLQRYLYNIVSICLLMEVVATVGSVLLSCEWMMGQFYGSRCQEGCRCE